MTQTQQRESVLMQWLNSDTQYRCNSLQMVSGDASFRRYFRFIDEHSGQSIIAVDAPPEFEDSQRFVDIADAYQQHDVHVPKVLAHNATLGFYCLSDFGDRQFSGEVDSNNFVPMYAKALSQLPAIQSCTQVNGRSLPEYDDKLLQSELYLFTHWLLNVHLGVQLDQATQALVQNSYQFILDSFKSQPQVGVHRDYHSRNLMITGQGDIGVIDFQDAVIGPITYDAASLLRDCYQDWPDHQVMDMLKSFYDKYYSQYSWSDFVRWFDLVGVQRHIKASGIFCRLFHRDNKSMYLQDIPHTLNYIVTVCRGYPELAEFGRWIQTHIKPKVEELL